MKWGLVARCNDRGIASITREMYRNLQPTKTLVVQPDNARHMPQHHQAWYPGEPCVQFSTRGLSWADAALRNWLDGLDVVVMVETVYDERFTRLARECDVRTVCWVMPEYFKGDADRCDVLWAPTRWRLDRLPARTRVVPVPVPIDRWPDPDLTVGDPPRWLHVAGARAQCDRNGTRIVLATLQLLRRAHHVTIRAQDEDIYPATPGPKVRLELHHAAVGDYWDLYADQDALVMPRRYGGLSMPALEAMGAGLALVMPDVAPQREEWPCFPINAPFQNHIVTGAGRIPLCAPDPRSLAKQMDRLADCPDLLDVARRQARAWAEAHSWGTLGPTILEELEHAAALVV